MAIKKALNSERMTVIMSGEESEENYSAPSEAEAVAYRDGVIVTNKDGQMRFMSQKAFTTAKKDFASFGEDALPTCSLSVNNKGTLYAVTNLGNVVKIDVTTLPEKKFKEKPFKLGAINQDAQTGESIVKLFFFEGVPVGELVLFTKQGGAKRVDLSEFSTVSKSYLKAINLAEKDEVVGADIVDDEKNVMEVTKEGQVLAYKATEIPLQGRTAAGVKGIKLGDTDSVVFAGQVEEEGEIIVVSNTGYAKRVIASLIDPSSRYLKGVKIIELDKSYVKYVGTVKMPYDLAFVSGGQTSIVNTENIRIDTRTTKGKQLFKQEVTLVTPVNEPEE